VIAVDAGSSQISVLRILPGGSLALVRAGVVPSGGVLPVSVAVHGNLVYVANAGTGGSSYTGFRLTPVGRMAPVPGSAISLPSGSQPGDVLFNGTGTKLAGTRVGTSQIDSFTADWPRWCGMASSTGEGSWVRAWQAHPVAAAMVGVAASRSSPRTPVMLMCRVPGRRWAGCPVSQTGRAGDCSGAGTAGHAALAAVAGRRLPVRGGQVGAAQAGRQGDARCRPAGRVLAHHQG